MAEFLPAHRKTKALEAGYANNPHDRGGETWRGIARKFWPAWEGWHRVDAVKKVLGVSDAVLQVSARARTMLSVQLGNDPDLEAMVDAFFQKEFWDAIALDEEPSQALAEKVYDVCVNMGGKPSLEALRGAYARVKAETDRLGLKPL